MGSSAWRLSLSLLPIDLLSAVVPEPPLAPRLPTPLGAFCQWIILLVAGSFVVPQIGAFLGPAVDRVLIAVRGEISGFEVAAWPSARSAFGEALFVALLGALAVFVLLRFDQI